MYCTFLNPFKFFFRKKEDSEIRKPKPLINYFVLDFKILVMPYLIIKIRLNNIKKHLKLRLKQQ